MAKGFHSLDQQLGWPERPDKLGDIVQVDYGYRTGWLLVAEYETRDGTLWLTVDNPISYRVHDERELLSYWSQRALEEAPISIAYEIETSSYLDELRAGATGLFGTPLRHFLVSGQNICLEVIAAVLPDLHRSPPVLIKQLL